MNKDIQLCINHATACKLAEHLRGCDRLFIPPLSSRLSIDAYTQKIITHAQRFEAWDKERLIGLVAAYCNDDTKHTAYITNVSVLSAYQGLGLAHGLLTRCLESIGQLQFKHIELEVAKNQIPAISLYTKLGFKPTSTNAAIDKMILNF